MRNAFASSKQLSRLLNTSSLDELLAFIRTFDDQIFPPLGLITSPAGWGKTMAISYLAANEFGSSSNGMRPSTLLIKIPTAPTNLAIAQTMVDSLGDELPDKRRSANSLATGIAEKLIEFGVERIFFDEANRLTEGTFDFIRMIFEALICGDVEIKFFLVGLPSIISVIRRQEQFGSRTIHLPFSALSEDEVLNAFLPNLQIAGWNFDPGKKTHLKLGHKLWMGTKPSLRRLVYGIQGACSLNIRKGNALEFSDLIDLAIYMGNTLTDEGGNEDDESESEPDQSGLGPHEERSVNRNENRRGKGKKGDTNK